MSLGNVKGLNTGGDLIFQRKNDGVKLLQLRQSQPGPIIEPMVKASFAATQNIVITAAQLLGGLIDHGTATGGGTATLPVGSAIDAAIPGVANNDAFECVYANTGSQTGTITAPDGTITLVGTVAVTTGKVAYMTFFRTGTAAWTVYCTVG